MINIEWNYVVFYYNLIIIHGNYEPYTDIKFVDLKKNRKKKV